VTFMVSSKMGGGSNPLTLPGNRSLPPNTPWDLEKVDVQADPIVVSGRADTDGQV
jgi:hypothetical protein